MSIDNGLRKALLAQAAITAITSNVFVNTLPQVKQLPAIVIQKRGKNQNDTFEGGSFDDLKTALFDIECIAKSEREAIALGDAVEESMSDYVGPMDDQTCEASFHQDSEMTVQDLGDGSGFQIHYNTVDFQFMYRRTI